LSVCSNLSYTCLASAPPGQPSLACTTTWANAIAVLGVTVVTDGKADTTQTTVTVTETPNGITAYGIQVRFKPGDPTPTPSPDDSVSALQFKKGTVN
jgi:hypothetical protein